MPQPRTDVQPSSGDGRTPSRSEPGRDGQQTGRTIGPVSDLERHLPTEWWRTLFNSIYLKTDGDVVENDSNTRKDIDLLVKIAGLEPNDRVLDLCCGQGRHCLELAKRGFRNVTGVDRSRYLVRLARRRARQGGLTVSFHEGDARRFRLPADSFHCVAMLGNSFGYFDREEDDIAVLRSVLRVLKGSGMVVLDLTDGQWMRDHFERRSWEWIDQEHLVCRERSLSTDQARLITREVVIHAERGVIADQFYAERLYSREHITGLLERAGFTSVRHHGGVEADSDRGQDLGMMAHRMFLSAVAPAKKAPRKKQGPAFPNVTVLLGDPSIADSVKRDGQFNEEDFDTVDRLKKALGELNGFEFTFLDHHATLISDLRTDPPDFVLNLCDEGFQNDAFMELHVPALLDMLNVPYTGAGPACLGMCYNKFFVRSIAEAIDIAVPAETYFDPGDQAATLPSAFPAFIKPNFGDSSVGITKESVVHSPQEFVSYLETLRETLPGRPILVQEYLTGNEYTVGVIGNPGTGYTVLPALEVDFSGLDPKLPRILGYESKWLPESPYWNQVKYREAEIDENAFRRLSDASTMLFERLGCRDYARFDFRADASGVIKLLEANPNPGWCWDGKLNFMAEYAGLRYADLLRMIIEAAQERCALASTTAALRSLVSV